MTNSIIHITNSIIHVIIIDSMMSLQYHYIVHEFAILIDLTYVISTPDKNMEYET